MKESRATKRIRQMEKDFNLEPIDIWSMTYEERKEYVEWLEDGYRVTNKQAEMPVL